MASWTSILPRLVHLQQRGQLVPFVGAGISYPVCPLWPVFVAKLEAEAGLGPGAAAGEPEGAANRIGTPELIRRANVAVRRLRAAGPGRLTAAVGRAITGEAGGKLPRQADGLARIAWPLILTTNYDNIMVEAVWRQQGVVPRVLGRGELDCFGVGQSLREPSEPVLWALQGFLDGPMPLTREVVDPEGRLARELVVGHEEYRRATWRDGHFRRAFAEVFRSRSLFFVGSGLQEDYFLSLFSEIREVYGPNPHQHIALVEAGRHDPEFLESQFQIRVVEYDPAEGHRELQERLEELGRAVRSGWVGRSWTYGRPFGEPGTGARMRRDRSEGISSPESRLVVVVGGLPGRLPAVYAEGSGAGGGEGARRRERRRARHCIAVSRGGARGAGGMYLSPSMKDLLRGYGLSEKSPHCWDAEDVTGSFDGQPVYTVRAREGRDVNNRGRRSLRAVYRGMQAILARAAADGFHTLHLQLLASGEGMVREFHRLGEGVPYRPLHAFAEMVRAMGDHLRAGGACPEEVRICLVDAPIYQEIAWGRMQVEEWLCCADLRLWATVERSTGPVEYHRLHVTPDGGLVEGMGVTGECIGQVAGRLQVPGGYRVRIWPMRWRVPKDLREQTVDEVAAVPVTELVVAGSLLRFLAPEDDSL